jgi:hypothetical protein
MTETFAFDHLWQMSEADFQRLVDGDSVGGPRTARTYARFALWTAFGVVLLYFPRSFGFGVIELIIVGIAFFWRSIARRIGDPRRIHTPYLREAVRSGADQDGYWLSCSDFDIRVHWRALRIWELKDGWLLLSANSVPTVYLPVAEMQRRGVYDAILAAARQHGKEYGSAEAQREAFAGGDGVTRSRRTE